MMFVIALFGSIGSLGNQPLLIVIIILTRIVFMLFLGHISGKNQTKCGSSRGPKSKPYIGKFGFALNFDEE